MADSARKWLDKTVIEDMAESISCVQYVTFNSITTLLQLLNHIG